MKISLHGVLLPLLAGVTLTLNAVGTRGDLRSGLHPSATLLQGKLHRHAHISQKTSLRRTGQDFNLDAVSDKLQGALDTVKGAVDDLKKDFNTVQTMCIDQRWRYAQRIGVNENAVANLMQNREKGIEETAKHQAKLEYLLKVENEAKAGYDSSVAQRAQDLKAYLKSNQTLVEQTDVIAQVINLLNAKKDSLTPPQVNTTPEAKAANILDGYNKLDGDCYGANLKDLEDVDLTACLQACSADPVCTGSSYGDGNRCVLKNEGCNHTVQDGWTYYEKAPTTSGANPYPAQARGGSQMDYIIGVFEELKRKSAKTFTEQDSSFDKSDAAFVKLVNSYKVRLQHADAEYQKENALKLQAEAAVRESTEERSLRSLFISGEEGLLEMFSRVCSSSTTATMSLAGCYDASKSGIEKPFTLVQGDDAISAYVDGLRGSGLVKDGMVTWKWDMPGAKELTVPVDKLSWTKISDEPCGKEVEQGGLIGVATNNAETSLTELEGVVKSTLSTMDSLPTVSTGFLQKMSAERAAERPQSNGSAQAQQQAAEMATRQLNAILESRMGMPHSEVAVASHTTLGRGLRRSRKPVIKVKRRRHPVVQASGADNSLHFLIGRSSENVTDEVVTTCIREKQEKTAEILAARSAARIARSEFAVASMRSKGVSKLLTMVRDQKAMLLANQNAMSTAYAGSLMSGITQRFPNAISSALNDVSKVKTGVERYIAAGGPPEASGVITALDSITSRISALKAKTEADEQKLQAQSLSNLLNKFAALEDQLDDKINPLQTEHTTLNGTVTTADNAVKAQEATVQQKLADFAAIEYKCQSPGTCGALSYQSCCGAATHTHTKTVYSWSECTQHCESMLAAGHKIVGCEMQSDDASKPGLCHAETTCNLASGTGCAGSRCKPTSIPIGFGDVATPTE